MHPLPAETCHQQHVPEAQRCGSTCMRVFSLVVVMKMYKYVCLCDVYAGMVVVLVLKLCKLFARFISVCARTPERAPMCMRVCECMCMRVRVCMCRYMCSRVCMCVWMCMCTRVRMCVRVRLSVYVRASTLLTTHAQHSHAPLPPRPCPTPTCPAPHYHGPGYLRLH